MGRTTDMKVLTILPAMSEEECNTCLNSIARPDSAAEIKLEDIRVIDNSKDGFIPQQKVSVYRDPDGHNLGIARSWNIGAREVVEKQYDYLLIMSSAMLFGPMKEITLMEQLRRYRGENVIESDGHSWHLVALHRRLFEKIGYFDENFYPAYFEQIDWCYRLEVLGLQGAWPRVWVNALSTTVGKYSYLTLAPPLLEYYRQKWGGDKGEEKYKLPFKDKPMDYFPNNSIPDLARKYELKEWW